VFLHNLGKHTYCRWLLFVDGFSYLGNYISEEKRLVLIFMCLKLIVSGWSGRLCRLLDCGLDLTYLRNALFILGIALVNYRILFTSSLPSKWIIYLTLQMPEASFQTWLCLMYSRSLPTEGLISVVAIFFLKKMFFRYCISYGWLGELRQFVTYN